MYVYAFHPVYMCVLYANPVCVRLSERIESICTTLSSLLLVGQFFIDSVVPTATGESSKVKVKVRVNINGVFTVSSATLIEKKEQQEVGYYLWIFTESIILGVILREI